MFEDELAAWQERVEAVRRANERLGPQAEERAKQYEHLTLEEIMARWAEVMSRRSQWDSDDDFEVEVMAIFSILGVKMRERGKVLRAAGFEYDEPMQQRIAAIYTATGGSPRVCPLDGRWPGRRSTGAAR